MVLGNHGATVRRLCGRRTVSLKDNQPLAMQGKKKEAQQRTFPMIYLLIHLRNGADAGGRGVKQLAAGAVNTGSSVKDRDRGAMTGKFYRAKNAGESSGRKRQTEERTVQSAQTRRKGTERRKMPLGRKRRRKPDGKGRKKDFRGAGNGKTNEKSVNFIPERAKALAWRGKKEYNGTEQDERAGTE